MREDLPLRIEDDVRAYLRAARRLAAHLVRDADEADDIAQESMRVALERPPAPGRAAWPWVAGIVRRLAWASHRARRRRPATLEVAPRVDADPARLTDAVEAARRLLDAVLQLEDPYRNTVILRYVHDLPPPQIATMQDVPLETVRTRLRRGLARLRQVVRRDAGGHGTAWTGALAPLLPRSVAPALPTLIGVTVMKKALVAVACLVLLTGATWSLLAWDDDGSAARPAGMPPSGLEARTRAAPALHGPPNQLQAGRAGDPAGPGQVAITGRVVGAGRYPAPGVHMRLTSEGRVVSETSTTGDGRFRMPWERSRVEDVSVLLTAEDGAGRVAMAHPRALRGATAGIDVGTLTLVPGAWVRVRVTRDGRPVRGARVLAWSNDYFLETLGDARTGRDGLARVGPVPLRPLWMVASAPGHGRGTRVVPLPLPHEHVLALALSAPRDVAVRVTERGTGRPLEGIPLEVREKRGPGSIAWPYVPPLDIAPTDHDGRTRIAGLGSAVDLEVAWRYPGFPPKRRVPANAPPTFVTLRPAQRSLVIEIPALRVVRWHVHPGRVPAPRPDAGIRIVSADDLQHPLDVTAEMDAGDLVVRSLPPGPFEGYAIDADGAMAWLVVPARASQADYDRLRTIFRRPRRLEVGLHTPDGSPLPGVRIRLLDEIRRPVASGVTDDGGHAVFDGLYGHRLEVYASAGSVLLQRMLGVADLESGDAQFDATLERAVTITLRTEIDGRPRLPDAWWILVDGRGTRSAEEDPERGTLTIRVRSHGGVVPVRLEAEGFAPVEVEARPGEAVPVRLVRTARVSVAFRPPADAQYRFELDRYDAASRDWAPAPGVPLKLRPDAEGRLVIDGLVEGRYRLVDWATQADTGVFEVVGAATVGEVALDLHHAGMVRGSVSLPDGVRPTEAYVEVTGASRGNRHRWGPRRQRLKPDGSFAVRVPGDRPVTFRPYHPLLSAAPGDEGSLTLIRPRDGLELRLVRGARARLQFEPPLDLGSGVVGPIVRVLLFDGGVTGTPQRDVTPDVSGSLPISGARFGGYRPGRYTLWIDVAHKVPVVLRDVELGAGETDLGTVPVDVGSRLRVHLLVTEGQAVPRVAVFARSLDRRPSYQRTAHGAGGKEMVVSGLGAGRFDVVVSRQDASSIFRRTVVADGENDLDLTVDLRR